MKRERIEELLRARPADEPIYRGVIDLDVPERGAVTRAARDRGSRIRAARALASVASIALLAALAFAQFGGAGLIPVATAPASTPLPTTRAGVVPWLDATPGPTPTTEPTLEPSLLPTCDANVLALAASGWEGATGSLAGGALLINLSAEDCRVAGRPALELLPRKGGPIATAGSTERGTAADAVALPPGGVARLITVWSNWCADPPARPLFLRLALPDGGSPLSAEVREAGLAGSGGTPRCDAPGAASTISAPLPFAAPEPTAVGAGSQSCEVTDLAAYSGDWGAAAGTSYTELVVLNGGGIDCRLPSEPGLELRDADAAIVELAATSPAATSDVVLPAGRAAVATIGFSNWCVATPVLPLQLDIRFGSAIVKVIAHSPIPVPACMSSPATPPPSLFYDGPLSVPGTPAPPEPDPADSLPLSVGLSDVPVARPGSVLDYTVTLTNVSAYDKPLNLAAVCPAYTERLLFPNSTPAIERRLQLDCEPVGTLAAGASVSFEMRLEVPADMPAGSATLVWQLGERGPAAKVSLEVVGSSR